MTIITATEFKNNLGVYLDCDDNDDILITKNGKVVKMLTKPNNIINNLNNLVGSLDNASKDYDDYKYSYLKEKYNL